MIDAKRVEELREWLKGAEGDGYTYVEDGRATDDLLQILDEREQLIGANKMLGKTAVESLAQLEKVKAELLSAQMTNAKNGAVIIEQMVQLEKLRPLVDETMGANIQDLKDDIDFIEDLDLFVESVAILRAALKLRESKEKT